MNPEAISTMLKAYRDVVSEYAYTPEYARAVKQRRREEVSKKRKKQESDDDLLKRVQHLSGKDAKE